LIEFSIVAIPVLLLGLGGIEIAHWHLTRQALSLALLEAGRAGITDHARPLSMAARFEQALLPLFPASSTGSARQNQQAAFQQRQHTTGAPPWHIAIVSPTPQAFQDFAEPSLSHAMGHSLATINNHYQFEQ